VTFRGTLPNVNAALDGLTFTPAANFTGQADLTVTTSDLGSSGTGAVETDTDIVALLVDTPEPSVYWNASKDTVNSIPATIGRADLDGGGGARLVTGPELGDTPVGLAIDVVGERIYWYLAAGVSSATPGFWSAKLDGTDKELFMAASAVPSTVSLNSVANLVIDQSTRRLYWANFNNNPSGATTRNISYLGLDDPSTGGTVCPNPMTGCGSATMTSPRGLALDAENGRVYWSNAGTSESLAFAPLPGASGTSGTFSETPADAINSPSGVALDPDADRLYWTNSSGAQINQRLRSAPLAAPGSAGETSITASIVDISPRSGGGMRAPAIDLAADRLYYADTTANVIAYADLTGAGNGGLLTTAPAGTYSPDGTTILKAPEEVLAPSITGFARVGNELTCGDATWAADAVGSSLYRMPKTTDFGQWTLNGTPIAGATAATYTPTEAGDYRCTRTATNFAGTTVATSAPVTVLPQSPACSGPSVSTPYETPVEIALSCTGAGPMTFAIAVNPVGGTISSFAAAVGTLTYTPSAGFSGSDSIGYRATNAGGDSNTTSAIITVGQAPASASDPPTATTPSTATTPTTTPPSADPPAGAAPSNAFVFGTLRAHRARGTATLTVRVPGAGRLVLAGKGLKHVTRSPAAAGDVKLPIAATGAARKRLERRGSARVRAKVTFQPTGGTARSRTRRIALRLDGA
jgi:hypothetical protein